MNEGSITVTFVDEPGRFRFQEIDPAALRERIQLIVKETD